MTIDDDIERAHREVEDALKHFEWVRFLILCLIPTTAIVYGAMVCNFISMAFGTFTLAMVIVLRSKPEETGEDE